MDDAVEVFEKNFIFLATGGFGAVFLLNGHQPPTVLKSIQERYDNDDEIFLKEVNAFKTLNHEHIVKYYGIGKFVNSRNRTLNLGIMMEFCERGTLRDWIYKKTVIYSIYTVICWSRQLFSALEYLEKQKIVHRDLKPANILVCEDFKLKICDFGSIKVNDQTCTTHSLAGTSRYMSPEQCQKAKSRQLSSRSDVYSTGLVLWEIIERRKVFSTYGIQFDYTAAGQAKELFEVEPFECIADFLQIIRSCTKFDLKLRLKASEIVVLLKTLEEKYSNLNFTLSPQEDETQLKLLKPIGFDGSRERRVTVEEYEDSIYELSHFFKTGISSITSDWVKIGSSNRDDIESLHTGSSTNFRYIRGAYFTNWSQYRSGRAKYVPGDYLPGLCTHIFYAFATIGLDFRISIIDETDLDSPDGSYGQYNLINNLKQKQPGLRILLSIGGLGFGTKLFEKMSSEKLNRKIFIDSVIAWVREHNLDGIDLCWLFPKNQNHVDYADLLEELRDEIEFDAKRNSKQEKLLLSAAVSAVSHRIEAYNIPKMAESLDFVNLLTYYFWWHPSKGTTGMNSPLYARKGMNAEEAQYNIDWAANHWHQRGFPKEKIIIGVPTFGFGWNLEDTSKLEPGSHGNTPTAKLPESDMEGFGAYYEICDLLDNGAKPSWHDEHKVPWLVENGRWWTYESPESIALKMDFIKANGFGGAFAWTLDFDDYKGRSRQHQGQKYPLIRTIAKELGGLFVDQD